MPMPALQRLVNVNHDRQPRDLIVFAYFRWGRCNYDGRGYFIPIRVKRVARVPQLREINLGPISGRPVRVLTIFQWRLQPTITHSSALRYLTKRTVWHLVFLNFNRKIKSFQFSHTFSRYYLIN